MLDGQVVIIIVCFCCQIDVVLTALDGMKYLEIFL